MCGDIIKLDLKNAKKYGHIYGTYDGTTPHLIISDPELIEKIYVKNFNQFMDHVEINSPDPLDMNQVLALSGDHWKKVRSVLTHGMTPSKLNNMYQLVQTKDLLHFVKGNVGKELKIYQMYSLHVLNIVTRSFFGLDMDFFNQKDHEMVKRAQDVFEFDIWKMFVADRVPSWMLSLIGYSVMSGDSISYIKQFVTHAVKDRMKDAAVKKNDLIQTLLDAHNEASSEKQNLTEIEVIANGVFMIAAAFDTTAITASFVSYELAKNPDKQKLLQTEIESVLRILENGLNDQKLDFEDLTKFPYLEAVINETLRLHSMDIRGYRRVSVEGGTNLPGTDIHLPKGTVINVAYYALHARSDLFPEPKKFIPERFLPENKHQLGNCAFMSFGAGPRMCPGVRFAMINLKSVLVSILKDYSFVCTNNTLDQIPVPDGRLMISGKPIALKITKG